MKIAECMTQDIEIVNPDQPIREAAQFMLRADAGIMPVSEGDKLVGMVTDRDIAVRAVAEGREPQSTTAGDICSSSPRTLEPGDSVEVAAQAMGENSIRRLPVVRDGELVGVLSLGDLAQDRDAGPPLADISAASPNH